MASSLCDFLVRKSSKSQGKVLFKVLETLTCSICHEYMYVPMMTQCGHNYCYDCLFAWFESNAEEELSCPQCRASVINTPSLNSALQQWLHAVFEVLEEEEDDDEDEKELIAQMMEARRKCEQHYKQDEKKDNLFDSLFKNTAVGIVDKDDDGILRCSNCHWELEDDEDDVCPHCSFRIRGRPVGGRTGTESEEEYSSDEYARGHRREPSLVSYAEYATEYIVCTMGFVRKVNDSEGITTEEVDHDSPLRFYKHTLSDGSLVYYPSFSAYYYFSYSSCLMNRRIFVRIIQELETHNLNGSGLEQFIQAEYRSYQEKSHDGISADAFEAKVECLQLAAREYRTAILEQAEGLKNINDPSLEEFIARYPLYIRKSLENNIKLLIPSYSLLARFDYTLTADERDIVVPMVKHLESTSCNHHHHHSAEEEDSSMDDFIASDDDEIPHNNLVDLDASEHSSDGRGSDSNSEELDSDYFERNEGDGFVSGDSLDDGHRDHRDTSEEEEEEDEREDEYEDEDGDGDLNVVHKARKRHRAIVDVSEDESM